MNWPKSGPFQGLACTIIEVDNGPFESWMVSSTGFDRYVELYNPQGGPAGTGGWESHWVFDFDDFLQGAGFKKIGISPAVSSSLASAGKRYIISGDDAHGTPREVVQSGEWDEIAQHSYGVTSFSLPSWCYISPYQTGWTLQPDINVPAYLPILSVNAGTFSGSTVTVSGDYASLASSSSGTFFRIFAPPGTERKGPYVTSQDAGLLSPWVSATSSRYLFGGYRYESPAAGRADPYGGPPIARQSGWNFTGLYYTLNRHYDPFLMRFTSIDPAAAPFYNLYAYCRGNPAAFFDPDGLDINTDATGSSEGDDSEDPMLYRWSHFLFDDYMATGERGEHARDTFNARALNFLTVGTAISDKDVAVFDKLAESKGHSDVAARSADAFETTKTLSYLIPGPAGTVAFGLDFANRMADGESPNVVDVLFIAAHLPALRNAGRALRAEMAEGRAAIKAGRGQRSLLAGGEIDNVVRDAAAARQALKGGLLHESQELGGYVLQRNKGVFEVIGHGDQLRKAGAKEIASVVRSFAMESPIRRVNLIACTTAGKSKLAAQLAEKMRVPVIGATQNMGVVGPPGTFVGQGVRGSGQVNWGPIRGRWRAYR